MAGEVGEGRLVGVRARQHPEDREQADDDERADRHDLDTGEPELELAVGTDRYQVRRGQHQHHDEGPAPLRYRGHPARQDLGAGRSLDREHHDPEEPVQPADGETGPAAERAVGVLGEGAGGRVGGGHLAQHAHHEDDEGADEGVGQQNARSGRGDAGAGADEQAGADHTADGDHRQVSVLEACLKSGTRRGHGRIPLRLLSGGSRTETGVAVVGSDTGFVRAVYESVQ